MTSIKFSNFKGIAPKYNEEQLADGYSVTSTNTRVGRGILEPFRSPSDLIGGDLLGNTGIKSLFKYNAGWMAWTAKGVKAVKAPLKNDPYDQVVMTGYGSYPQITSNTDGSTSGSSPIAHRLGVPAPTKITMGGGYVREVEVDEGDPQPSDDEFDIYYTSYVVVYVDAWGRVGPASVPSSETEIKEHDGLNLVIRTVILPLPPSRLLKTDSNRGTSAFYRVYRANYAANGSGVYQFLTDVPIGDSSFIDSVSSDSLGEAIATADWVGPPDDDASLYPNGALQNIVSVAGSFLAGHTQRAICFSEPDAMHAWPVSYYQVVPENIVVTVPMGSALVALTDNFPYVFNGVHPESMSPTRLADPIPCSAAAAAVELNDSVYFANEFGLFRLQGYSAQNVSKSFMTEKEWRALEPNSMSFSTYDGRLVIASEEAGLCYMFDPANPADGLRVLDIDPQAIVQLETTNDLAYVERYSSKIVSFDTGSSYTSMSWKSKVYTFNSPVLFSVGKVEANTYPINVTFVRESLNGVEEKYTKTVQSPDFFYLPFTSHGKRWWTEVSSFGGTSRPEIRTIQIAQSPEELS